MSDGPAAWTPLVEEPPPPPPERDPFWGYSDIALFIGLALPCLLLSFGVVKGLLAYVHIPNPSGATEVIGGQAIFYALIFLALRVIFQIQYGKPFWASLGWTKMRLPVPTIAMLGVASAIGVALSSALLRVPDTPNQMTEMMRQPASLILMAIFGVTVAPLCEELAFRGFLQPLLVRSLGPAAGIFIAAAGFGLLHYHEYGNSWRHAVVLTLSGASFGVMRQVTKSTKAAAVMHASYNGFLFMALFLEREGFAAFVVSHVTLEAEW